MLCEPFVCGMVTPYTSLLQAFEPRIETTVPRRENDARKDD